MASTIDTTTSAAPPVYASQRALDRHSLGPLWSLHDGGSNTVELWYQALSGGSFNNASLSVAGWDNGSMFIDPDDYLWLTWKQTGTGGSRVDDTVYVLRATPNTAGTSYTLGTPVALTGSTTRDRPNMVVFRDPASPGAWRAVVCCDINTGSAGGCSFYPLAVAADGTITQGSEVVFATIGAGSNSTPSVDFHHVGDHRTVQGGTPHLYFWWCDPVATTVKFVKYTYSAGSWTGGSSRNVDVLAGSTSSVASWFDGTRSLCLYLDAGGTDDPALVSRDAADTATTTYTVPAFGSESGILGLSGTSDEDGDVYIVAVGGTSADPQHVTYDRSGNSWGSWTSVESTTAIGSTVSVRNGASWLSIDARYQAGTGSPWNVRYAQVAQPNAAPTAPSWVTTPGGKDVASSLTIDWDFNDPNTTWGDVQSAYRLKRIQSGVTRYWTGSAWDASETWVSTANTYVTLSSSWATHSDAVWALYVNTKDAAGVAGTESAALSITPSQKVNPSITVDTSETTASRTTAWTVSELSAYRCRLLNGSTVLNDSGWVASTTATSYTHPVAVSNGASLTEELTTRNAEGLESTVQTQAFTVTYSPPYQPGLTITSDSPTGAVTIVLSNPEPTGDRPEILHNYLYRRVGDTGDGIRVAIVEENGTHVDWTVASGVDYQYYASAIGVNGTVSGAGDADDGGGGSGAWTWGDSWPLVFA